MMLWWLSACGSSVDIEPEDRVRYLSALEDTDPVAGLVSCDAITDESVRGDCRDTISERLVASGRVAEAEKICAGMESALWKDECYFLLSDKQETSGQDAV